MDHSKTLKDKTALVTGGTSGIGYYTALGLARLGAAVSITGRDERRGQEAESRLRSITGNEEIHFQRADASTVGGNQALAQQIQAESGSLHILVNNVGGLYNDRWETEDGYEASLAMNLVGPFALTEALLPLLRRSTPARVVNVSSAGYVMLKGGPFDDIHSKEAYNGTMAYARTKLLNLLWTLALARRLEGSGVVVNALHPGTAWTSMTQSNEARILPDGLRFLWPLYRLLQRTGSPEKAARTSIFLASAPEAANLTGLYFESSTRPKNPGPVALDRANQEKAWELAEALVRQAPSAVLNRAV